MRVARDPKRETAQNPTLQKAKGGAPGAFLAFNSVWSEWRGLRSAVDAITLPQAKPRAIREPFIVPSIRSREVACGQRSGVRHCEDSLKVLDFGEGSVNVHAAQIRLRLQQAY